MRGASGGAGGGVRRCCADGGAAAAGQDSRDACALPTSRVYVCAGCPVQGWLVAGDIGVRPFPPSRRPPRRMLTLPTPRTTRRAGYTEADAPSDAFEMWGRRPSGGTSSSASRRPSSSLIKSPRRPAPAPVRQRRRVPAHKPRRVTAIAAVNLAGR